MGFFGKKEKKEEEIPMLPRLPRLPDLPDMGDHSDMPIHQLPGFPSSSIGAKFSRDAVKEAVSGEKRDEFWPEDFSDKEMSVMRNPPVEEIGEDMEGMLEMPSRKMSGFRAEVEPVFVRIDKFEEGLKLFETLRDQISSIERNLAETKRIKEKEEVELQAWEGELKRMKDELEKISSNIFSKV